MVTTPAETADDGDPVPAQDDATGATRKRARDSRRRGRRARTEPPPGTDPRPAPEPSRHASTENDARLRGDKPPHY